MPALLPILFTASHVVLAADSVPKFDVERTCRPAAAAATLPGRDSSACQRDEQTARRATGANTPRHSEGIAQALPHSIARQVMWNC
jgi:hypothetical protein